MPLMLNATKHVSIEAAAQRLADGKLVGMPTETVYGLAADADSASAVQQIFEVKGRPSDHPLIVHVAHGGPCDWRASVEHYARDVPPFALALMQAFWPGPLTIILARKPDVAAAAAGGQDSVGLRCPAHPVAQALLRAAAAHGVNGLAAPSANRFGRVSPTTAEHVFEEFKELSHEDLLVLDGGSCLVGIESTIVDATRGYPVLMRPGHITSKQLQAVCGEPVCTRDEQAPRASGTLASHYAPLARVVLMDATHLQAALDARGSAVVAFYARTPMRTGPDVLGRQMPNEAVQAAQALFATLRELDAQGVQQIWVETPPPSADWDGVRDRLQRAAA